MAIKKITFAGCLLSLFLISASGCTTANSLQKEIDQNGLTATYPASYEQTWSAIMLDIKSIKKNFYVNNSPMGSAPYYDITEDEKNGQITASGGMTSYSCGHRLMVKVQDVSTPEKTLTKVIILDRKKMHYCGVLTDQSFDHEILMSLNRQLGQAH